MNSKKSFSEKILAMGVKKKFKLYLEPESGKIILQVRKPAIIINGLLSGSAIDLYDNSTFRIWTGQKQKAKLHAKRYRVTIKLLEREALMFVPASLADEILPKFGAKAKRAYSKSALMEARSSIAHANKRLALKKHRLERTPGLFYLKNG